MTTRPIGQSLIRVNLRGHIRAGLADRGEDFTHYSFLKLLRMRQPRPHSQPINVMLLDDGHFLRATVRRNGHFSRPFAMIAYCLVRLCIPQDFRDILCHEPYLTILHHGPNRSVAEKEGATSTRTPP